MAAIRLEPDDNILLTGSGLRLVQHGKSVVTSINKRHAGQ